jgi:hypothetical protein
MTIRTALRLSGLTAAIIVSLALASSASARPAGIAFAKSTSVTISTQPRQVSGSWLQHRSAGSITVAAPKGPADRVSPAAPPVPETVVEQAGSSGFNWTDAGIGALAGVALAIMAAYAAIALRARRRGVALGI